VIVVSNTSPITNLAAIGQFDLLRQLYGEILIPDAVWDELNAGGVAWPGRDAVAESDWVRRHTVSNVTAVRALLDDLDRGEAESIMLALELGADLLLLDESDGRHHAQRLGLRVAGVIGTLRAAKERGHITALRPYLDALRSVAGFYIREDLYRSVLDSAGE
jgi:predicted nucleic acid-binding protein